MAKQAEDKKTMELKLKPETRGRKKVYATNAEKQKAYRERKGTRVLSVELPRELYDEFDAWVTRRAMDTETTKSQIIENVIRKQVLRKR